MFNDLVFRSGQKLIIRVSCFWKLVTFKLNWYKNSIEFYTLTLLGIDELFRLLYIQILCHDLHFIHSLWMVLIWFVVAIRASHLRQAIYGLQRWPAQKGSVRAIISHWIGSQAPSRYIYFNLLSWKVIWKFGWINRNLCVNVKNV